MERHGTADVLVLGGGAIGLTIAYELAGCGADVLERNELVGREASWASAGVMRQRVTTQDAYGWLARTSRSRHATLAEELLTEVKAESVRQFTEFHAGRGLRAERVEADAARQMEPHLTAEICAAAC